MTLNPKVQGSTPCASTIDGGSEFKSTSYLAFDDAKSHAQTLVDSLSDSLKVRFWRSHQKAPSVPKFG